jgi:transposase
MVRGRKACTPLAVLIEEYEAGASLREIARQHGMTHQNAHERLRRAGVLLRGVGGDTRRIPLERYGLSVEQLRRDRENHMSGAAIAKKYGVPRSSMYTYLEELGLPLIPRTPEPSDAQLRADHDAGMLGTEMALKYQMSRSLVYKRLAAIGLRTRQWPRPFVATSVLVHEHLVGGMSVPEIARAHAMTWAGVYLRLRRAGVTVRRS